MQYPNGSTVGGGSLSLPAGAARLQSNPGADVEALPSLRRPGLWAPVGPADPSPGRYVLRRSLTVD